MFSRWGILNITFHLPICFLYSVSDVLVQLNMKFSHTYDIHLLMKNTYVYSRYFLFILIEQIHHYQSVIFLNLTLLLPPFFTKYRFTFLELTLIIYSF